MAECLVALSRAQMLRFSCVVALLLVALNDHVFKGNLLFPRAFVNKASDFAGLYFFPFLCYDVCNVCFSLVRPFRQRPWLLACFLVFTGVVFLAAKIPGSSHAFVVEVARVLSPFPVYAVADPTDAVAIGVLPLAWWVFVRDVSKKGGSR